MQNTCLQETMYSIPKLQNMWHREKMETEEVMFFTNLKYILENLCI